MTVRSSLYQGYKRTQLAVRRSAIRGARLFARNGGAIHIENYNSVRVLFLRQNQIGDALISTPVFAALKAHYPDITIDVLLNRRNRSVFDTDPNLRKLYVIKIRKLDVLTILRHIRRERYDFIVDLVHSPSTTSSLFCLFGKARCTVGPVRENDYAYDVKVAGPDPDRDIASSESMMRKFMRVLTPFAIDPEVEPLRPYYVLTPESVSRATAMANRVRGGIATRRLIGINISGSKAEKYWGTATFVELIRQLKQQYPNDVFMLLYSAEYETEANAIADGSGAQLSGGTRTLNEFAAAIKVLDMLISTDSAAVHFADMFHVPIVTLVLDPPVNRLWLPSVTPFESVHASNHDIKSIDVDSVYRAIEGLHKRLADAAEIALTEKAALTKYHKQESS